MPRIAVFAALAFFLVAGGARAEVPRQLMWDDLIPPVAPIENPIAHLSNDDQVLLETVWLARRRAEQGLISKVEPEYEDSVEITDQLKKQGLDVDALLEDMADFLAKLDHVNSAVVKGLDSTLVRIPGYVLPLEWGDQGTDELLLVPYVGACIHVPPPPANQVVYVHLHDAYQAESLYEPVWITGTLSVTASSPALSLVDGAAKVDAAYRLDGILVEPYEP